MKCWFSCLLLFPFFADAQSPVEYVNTEVLVIGGGTGGTAAAIQSARSGAGTLLVEPTSMLGGMLTAAGVSCTDGNDRLASGIWEEFRQALYTHYGKKRLNSGWVSHTSFEPKVGDSIFKAWTRQENKLQVRMGYQLKTIIRSGNQVKGASFISADGSRILQVLARVTIDATELGDAFAQAGAGYRLGMDDPAETGEKEARKKNDIIQDLTWVAILQDYGPGADKTIPVPPHYSPGLYHCCCGDAPCKDKPWNGDKWKMLQYGKLPLSPGATRHKYMLNWPAHGNDIYLNVVEAGPDQRRKAYDSARNLTLGMLYFMQTELGMKQIGLAADEGENGLALIPYNREGRRIKGMVLLKADHIRDPYRYLLYRTGIAVGDYPVDHHHARYPGAVPELEFPEVPAYNIPLGTLIPADIRGMIVCEKGISVSNIVNGTTRLQPVVLLTGQAAGSLAALSVKMKKSPGEISVRSVQEDLLKAKAYLMPFTDVPVTDPHWEAIQRTGSVGILRGRGKPEGWANKMFFYPDSLVDAAEILSGFRQIHPAVWQKNRKNPDQAPVTARGLYQFLQQFRPFVYSPQMALCKSMDDFRIIWDSCNLGAFEPDRHLTRKEAAVLIDRCTELFNNRNLPVNLNGKYQFNSSTF